MSGLGIVLLVASTVGFCVAMTSLLDSGTCASGNTPFEISQPCPDGTGTKSLLLTLSILGAILSGGTFALRGNSPRGDEADKRLFLAGWSVFFTIAGCVTLIHVATSETITADAQFGGIVAGALFLLLGFPTLLLSAWRVTGH